MATGPDTENPYFSLNTTLAAPAPGNDDRGLITAHVKEYSVSNTPALKPQSGSHPFLNASIVLSNDRPADFFSEVVTIVRNQTETRYRVSQTDLNVNSLGVASNYDAYFTAQFFVQKSTRTRQCGLGGLICGSWTSWSSWANDGVRVLSIWRVNLVTNAVTQLVTRVNGYPDNMESGAVNTNDRYFFSPTTLTSTPTNSMQWTIYRLTGTAIQLSSVVTSVANSRPAGATGKGDFAFDSYNNLHIVTSGTGTTSKVATIDSSFIMETGNVNVPGVTLTDLTHPLLGAGNEIIGLAFPFDTYGVYGNREAHAIMDQANLGTILSSQTYTDDTQSDYASTVTKPKFQLKLNIPSRAVGTDQFTISAGPHGVLSSLNTTGSGTTYSLFSNPEIVDRTFYMPPWVEPNPKVSIPFSITGIGGTLMSNYTIAWTCTDLTSGRLKASGTTASNTFQMPLVINQNIECVFNLTSSVPDLRISKMTRKAGTFITGSTIGAGEDIEYLINFDNVGTGSGSADYTDYLHDVLDDADLLNSSNNVNNAAPHFTYSGDWAANPPTVTYNQANKTIRVVDSVIPGNSTSTLHFKVRVKGNRANPQVRAAGAAGIPFISPPLIGYRLRNFIAPTAAAVPTACALVSPPYTCTDNKVLAWTVDKYSQPQDGASLHSGGNIYYRIKVTNFSGLSMGTVSLHDDLTSTLFASVFDPSAPSIAGMGATYGINYYNEAGALISSIPWVAGAGPEPVYSGSPTFNTGFPTGASTPFNGTWTFSPSFSMPAMISGQVVKYAEIGYPVKVGKVASPANPKAVYNNAGNPVSAAPSASWVNTAVGAPATISYEGTPTPVASNRCAVDQGIQPGWDESNNSVDFPECKTYHLLKESYFHIWKNSTAQDPGNPGNVITNLLDSGFVISDTKTDAEAQTPSRWLCRVENNPYAFGTAPAGISSRPNGMSYSATGVLAAGSGTPDWGYESSTQEAIEAWNADPAHAADLKADCGMIYQLTAANASGQPIGAWRVENLRGGDVISSANPSPIPNWRTASGFNNGVNSTAGIQR